MTGDEILRQFLGEILEGRTDEVKVGPSDSSDCNCGSVVVGELNSEEVLRLNKADYISNEIADLQEQIGIKKVEREFISRSVRREIVTRLGIPMTVAIGMTPDMKVLIHKSDAEKHEIKYTHEH